MLGHDLRLYIPGLAVGEVRGQDAQRFGGIRGLVEETRGRNAQLLQDPVYAHDVAYGERQNPEALRVHPRVVDERVADEHEDDPDDDGDRDHQGGGYRES